MGKAFYKETTVSDKGKGKKKASNEDDCSSASQPPSAEDGAAVAKPNDKGGVEVPNPEV